MSEAKGVLEQAIEYWNAGDRDAWATLYAEDVVYEAPGGQRISGLADLEEKYFDALRDGGSGSLESRHRLVCGRRVCGRAGAVCRDAHRSAAEPRRS